MEVTLEQLLSKQKKIAMWEFICLLIGFLIVPLIVYFVFWIIGINNAVEINKRTQDSAVLIVFSIITFWFVHWIIAVSEYDKYSQKNENQVNNA